MFTAPCGCEAKPLPPWPKGAPAGISRSPGCEIRPPASPWLIEAVLASPETECSAEPQWFDCGGGWPAKESCC